MHRIVLITALLLFTVPLGAEKAFAPGQRDVYAGDELIYKTKHHRGHSHHHGMSVINGFQGGAWILIRFFQVVISPLDGPSCRYSPVCSAYGRGAVERHGALIGAIMTGDRILRCNPWGKGGYDPVGPLSSEK